MNDVVQVGSEKVAFCVTTAQSGGALMAFEVSMPPGGGPPVMHRHVPFEVYRVEEGELALHIERADGTIERIAAGPGDVVPIPSGRMHTVRNESDAPARAYVVFTPGNEMEGFIRAAGELAAAGPPEPSQVMALAARHGMEMGAPVG